MRSTHKIFDVVRLGLASLLVHKGRSALTALGILFGVWSVIAMLAISEGASQEAQQSLRELGSTNIIVRSVKPSAESGANTQMRGASKYGLTHKDIRCFSDNIPGVQKVVAIRKCDKYLLYARKKEAVTVIATGPEFMSVAGFAPMASGRFLLPIDTSGKPGPKTSCVITSKLARKIFEYDDPLSKSVEIGGEYFILLTTSAGFYRYHIGDQIRVVDFHGQAPVIEFLHKGQHVSSLAGEKLTEQQALQAFERACRTLRLAVDLFVLAPQWAEAPFYRLHLPRRVSPQPDGADRLAVEMDRQLRSANIEYASKQDSSRLGSLRVNLLPDGFLGELEARTMARRRGRYEQYKHRYLYPQPGEDVEFPVGSTQSAPEATRWAPPTQG